MQNNAATPLAHPIPAACARLGVGKTKLYELIAAGEIKTFKIGKRVLVPEADLVKVISNRLEAEVKEAA